MLSEITQYLAKYKLWNLNVFPIIYKDKKPAIAWASLQKRKASGEELINWFQDNEHNIAVVCGGISGNLVVLDFDSQDLYNAFAEYWNEYYKKPIYDMTPIVQTGGGGYHVYLKVKQKPQLYHPTGEERKHIPDIQSEGGYVLAPPSIHPNGNAYKFLNAVKTIHEVKSLNELAIDIPSKQSTKIEPTPIEVFTEGGRNNTLTSLAGMMRRGGTSQPAIEAALLEVNTIQCQPPLPKEEVIAIAKSMARYSPNISTDVTWPGWGGEGWGTMGGEGGGGRGGEGYVSQDLEEATTKRDKNVTNSVTKAGQTVDKDVSRFDALINRVRTWVQDTSGWWETRELDSDLNISGLTEKQNRRKVLQRLREEGIIEQHSKINKQFRYVDPDIKNLEFKTATNVGILPIRWPLGIEQFVNIFPSNMAVVAGSPNAGKTALLLNFIHKNQHDFSIYYFCSEMGAVELRDRLDKFPNMGIEDWKFEAIERAGDFADVIRPDCINIIDYLEMTTELFAINTHLTAISHKLGSGIAIVALQKKLGAAFGRGQEFGMEKPKLYLSMDKGKLQIIKGKSWAKKNVDPNGLRVSFKIIDGCQFETTGEWTR